MKKEEVNKLIKEVEWEIEQFERPSAKNSKKMLEIISKQYQSTNASDNYNRGKMRFSNCCNAPVIHSDICSDCKEHCTVLIDCPAECDDNYYAVCECCGGDGYIKEEELNG